MLMAGDIISGNCRRQKTKTSWSEFRLIGFHGMRGMRDLPPLLSAVKIASVIRLRDVEVLIGLLRLQRLSDWTKKRGEGARSAHPHENS